MTDSKQVLDVMKLVYVIYTVLVLSLVTAFALRLRRPGTQRPYHRVFYGWIGMLVTAGVGLHVLTFSKIPWVRLDLDRERVAVDREFRLSLKDHRFSLPQGALSVRAGETVRFAVRSEDYTYGFGLFRDDGSMVFQMQVVPGHDNRLVWRFYEPASYTIRSTEYSGPAGADLRLNAAVVVHERRDGNRALAKL